MLCHKVAAVFKNSAGKYCLIITAIPENHSWFDAIESAVKPLGIAKVVAKRVSTKWFPAHCKKEGTHLNHSWSLFCVSSWKGQLPENALRTREQVADNLARIGYGSEDIKKVLD